jgi:hypothetical protein
MLAVQEYLKENTIESLEKFGIFAKYHANKPYVILDYDMVESSKHKEDQKVCECRGLVLNTLDYSIVQKSFNRFFNLNEASCTDKFDWTHFTTSTKEDGSLIKVRWVDKNFLVTTRNSFADSIVGESGLSWYQVVHRCCTDDQIECIQAYNGFSFVFELCSPHNTVVVNHPEPKLVLLGIFDCITGDEVCGWWTDDIAKDFGFNRPQTFEFKSLEEVIAYLDKLEEDKEDTEGVVLFDGFTRLKAKSKWYLKLHRLSGNGNIALIKNILPLCLQGEKDEVLSYFPYLADRFAEVENILADLFTDLHCVWWTAQEIVEQKRFALYITRDNPTPFSSILFNLKKNDKITDYDAFKHEWNQSANLILKVLKED